MNPELEKIKDLFMEPSTFELGKELLFVYVDENPCDVKLKPGVTYTVTHFVDGSITPFQVETLIFIELASQPALLPYKGNDVLVLCFYYGPREVHIRPELIIQISPITTLSVES